MQREPWRRRLNKVGGAFRGEMMVEIATLITAIGTLIGAMIWPTVILVVLLVFRKELRLVFGRLPSMLENVKRIKFGGIEAELERVADRAAEKSEDTKGAVSIEEIRASASIISQAQDIGIQSLLRQLDRLCIEYDAVRRSMPSGFHRTQEMTRIVVKMRSLGPSVSDRIDIYMNSGSAGSRLAAVAMMQMEPRKGDLPWLVQRFSTEQPFIFYHSALALQNIATDAKPGLLPSINKGAQDALEKIKAFDGVPDQDSIEVLEALVGNRPTDHNL